MTTPVNGAASSNKRTADHMEETDEDFSIRGAVQAISLSKKRAIKGEPAKKMVKKTGHGAQANSSSSGSSTPTNNGVRNRPYTKEDDRKIVELIKTWKQKDTKGLQQALPDRTASSLRDRFAFLMKRLEKD